MSRYSTSIVLSACTTVGLSLVWVTKFNFCISGGVLFLIESDWSKIWECELVIPLGCMWWAMSSIWLRYSAKMGLPLVLDFSSEGLKLLWLRLIVGSTSRTRWTCSTLSGRFSSLRAHLSFMSSVSLCSLVFTPIILGFLMVYEVFKMILFMVFLFRECFLLKELPERLWTPPPTF